jgi:hypothetical protein
MNNLRTSPEEDHPEQGKLLLYISGEAGRDTGSIERHLQHCWQCVAAAERLRQGIHRFIEHRNQLLYDPIPVPPPFTRGLRARLRKEALRPKQSNFFIGLLRSAEWRGLQLAATFAVLVLGSAWFLLQPPKLGAEEVLRRAAESELQAGHLEERPPHRKIRIQRGSTILYWESHNGLPDVRRASDEAEWQEVLTGPLVWEDPLSAIAFSGWRAQVAGARDAIVDSGNLVTLTTSSGSGPILSSSLTLRHSDWHAVRMRITFRSEPEVDATELVYEVGDPGSTHLEQKAAVVLPGRRARNESRLAAARMSSGEIALAEIEARDVLFSLGVGLTGEEAGFSIASSPEGVQVELATQSAARRDAVEEALSSIRGLKARVLGPPDLDSAITNSHNEISSLSAPVPSQPLAEPLLWDYLTTHLGGAQAAMTYSTQVLASGGRVRSLVAQLDELALCFPPEAAAKMEGDAGARLDKLAGRMRDDLAAAVHNYDGVLSIAFEANWLQVAPEAAPATWQGRTVRLFELISGQDRLATRLFARSSATDQPSLSPEQAIRIFIDLNRSIAGLAVADPTN